MQSANWEVTGIEINPHAVQFARQRFELAIIQGELEDVDLPLQSFDAITFWDVIEHTFDPLTTLIKAQSLLKDEGILIMTLPNWESLDRKLFGPTWIGYDAPRHLYIFPREVLNRLLIKAGFEVLDMWCGLGGYFTFIASLRLWLNVHVKIPAFRKGILKILEIPGMRFFFQPLFSIIDRFGTGGTLVVVARKSKL